MYNITLKFLGITQRHYLGNCLRAGTSVDDQAIKFS